MCAQVKKLKRVQEAFEVFSSMMHTQGRAELTIVELRVSIFAVSVASLLHELDDLSNAGDVIEG